MIDPTSASGRVQVKIDHAKCQGHARCNYLASMLFELDQFGNAHEIGNGFVPPEFEAKARLAQLNCPEGAILIIPT